MALAFSVMMLTAFADGGVAQDLLPKMMIVFAALLGGGFFAQKRIGDWSRKRESQMEAIGRRIELRRDRAESSGSSLTAPVLERSSTEQINLPESSEEEGAPIMRERRRER